VRYKVIIESSAQTDLAATTLWLTQESEDAARNWYTRVREAIGSLSTMPLRCPHAPEDAVFDEEIRHLLHGRKPHVYRIIFTVRGTSVHVLHIRHGARNPLSR
jgi:plasmid stabilization system protein ParE